MAEYPKEITVRGENWTVYSAQQEADIKAGRLDGEHATSANLSNPAQAEHAPVVPNTTSTDFARRIRAKFVISQITKTSRGVSVVTFDAAHDPLVANTGGIGAPVVQRPTAAPANPKGSITLEVAPEYAASLALGQAFYLVSA